MPLRQRQVGGSCSKSLLASSGATCASAAGINWRDLVKSVLFAVLNRSHHTVPISILIICTHLKLEESKLSCTRTMDLSLDDLIKLKKQNQPQDQTKRVQSRFDLKRLKELGSRSGIKTPVHTQHQQHQQNLAKSNKLRVSNLHAGVTDKDMKELFQDIGPVKRAVIIRDVSGHSTGVAEIVFDSPQFIDQAIKEYNFRTLDGRPMHVKRVPGESMGQNSDATILDRLGVKVGSGIQKQTNTGSRKKDKKKRNRQKKNKTRERSEVPSVEELDAEMDAYRQSRFSST